MQVIDLTRDFSSIVKAARTTIDFKARFWTWLDSQRSSGPLAPLLSDMERHWSAVGYAPSLSEARDLLRLAPVVSPERVGSIARRFAEIAGELPQIEVVLLAGLGRPEGYSRFDEGRNTIFIGLDHPSALAHPDHLELILSHELCHAVRDPSPAVLEDYGGAPEMSHDDFVARHPFREHLVSEALATAISELAHPGLPDRRYVYFDEGAIRWCEEHRRLIAERMLLALERNEPYHTFYAEGSVAPGSPDCCDYWFGLELGRYALAGTSAQELLHLPSSRFLASFLQPFVDHLLSGTGTRVTVAAPIHERALHHAAAIPGEDALSGASLPASVRHVYEEYAALVRRRPQLARQLEEQLAETVRRQGLDYAGRPWMVHAFPLLLAADEERHVRWATDGLLRLIDRVVELYRSDREVRAFFDFPRHLDELCCLESGYRPHVMLGRFDSYWSGRRLRFLELNTNGTAGWVLAEMLGQRVLELPVLGDILKRHGAQSTPLTSLVLDGLLDAWRQVRGEHAELRRVAIVDWEGLPSASELLRFASDFSRMGVDAEFVPPARLEFDGSELVGPSGPIDLVYRRLTTADLIERAGELAPLIAAARARAVVVVGSFAADVAHSKRLFAFLTHERWERRLSPAERSLIHAHVPWTRMFVPGKTQFEGRMWDLRELALAERERFVLKPAESHEGQGVLLGMETASDAWIRGVESRFGAAHVIQELVRAPLRRLLLPGGDGVAEVTRWLHLGEFVVQGQLAGFLARVSEELVLTAEAEDRTLPCLVVNEDEADATDQDLGPATP